MVNFSNVTDMQTAMTWANAETSGMLGFFLLIGFWLALFFGLGMYRQNKGFASASMVTAILAIVLAAGGLVTYQIAIIGIVIAAGGFFLLD